MKRRIWIFGLIGIILMLIGIFSVKYARTIQSDQRIAERWDENAVQISVYFSFNLNLHIDDIAAIEDAITSNYKNDAAEEGENIAWYGAYSCEVGSVSAIGTKSVSSSLTLHLVSENYFPMHAYTILSGNDLSEADTSSGRVVLDEAAAWNLFGSVNAAGMTVTFDNRICEVAGVIRLPDDFATKQVIEDSQPGIYMLYRDYLSSYNFIGETEPAITTYEVVLPELLEGYAYSLMEKVLEETSSDWSVSDGLADENTVEQSDNSNQQYLLIQNINRFSFSNIWDYLFYHENYIVRTNDIPYSTSENTARILLHRIAMLMLFTFLGIMILFVAVIWGVISMRKQIQARWKVIGTLLRKKKKIFLIFEIFSVAYVFYERGKSQKLERVIYMKYQKNWRKKIFCMLITLFVFGFTGCSGESEDTSSKEISTADQVAFRADTLGWTGSADTMIYAVEDIVYILDGEIMNDANVYTLTSCNSDGILEMVFTYTVEADAYVEDFVIRDDDSAVFSVLLQGKDDVTTGRVDCVDKNGNAVQCEEVGEISSIAIAEDAQDNLVILANSEDLSQVTPFLLTSDGNWTEGKKLEDVQSMDGLVRASSGDVYALCVNV